MSYFWKFPISLDISESCIKSDKLLLILFNTFHFLDNFLLYNMLIRKENILLKHSHSFLFKGINVLRCVQGDHSSCAWVIVSR